MLHIYINLDESIDRNCNMIDFFRKLNCNFHRISAINMKNMDKNALKEGKCDDMKYLIREKQKFNFSPKHVAIILSHFKALYYALKNEAEYAVIMEDDMSFEYIIDKKIDWENKLNEIIINAPKDWSIIKLHTSSFMGIRENIKLYYKNVVYAKINRETINSGGCYIINKKAIEQLLEKYFIDGTFIFPHKNEYVVCESILFSLENVYIYTFPLFCVQKNNITSSGKKSALDINSNKDIYDIWKKSYRKNVS